MSRARLGFGAVLTAVFALLLSACGPTLADLPLPGSGVPGETIAVKADFDEALNLSTGATVKVNGVDAGKVQDVTVKDFRAQASMLVRTKAHLRTGATARLRYTTPLGELFIDVTNPPTGAEMAAGDVLSTKVTSTAPTVEDALAEASLLINGGGLSQLQTITTELNRALGGREDTVRSLFEQTNTFLGQANATTADVDRALRALAGLATELDRREGTIKAALRDIRPASRVLRANTDGLTKLLSAVQQFSGQANSTVTRTRDQILMIAREFGPVLAELNSTSGRFGPSLDDLIRLGGDLSKVVPGDYVSLGLHLKVDSLLDPILGGASAGGASAGGAGGGIGGLGLLDDLGLSSLLGGKK